MLYKIWLSFKYLLNVFVTPVVQWYHSHHGSNSIIQTLGYLFETTLFQVCESFKFNEK